MRKSLILAITALSGGVSYAAGVTKIAPDIQTSDPATWRWHVSTILADQKEASSPPIRSAAVDFSQQHQRYSAVGTPERK